MCNEHHRYICEQLKEKSTQMVHHENQKRCIKINWESLCNQIIAPWIKNQTELLKD